MPPGANVIPSQASATGTRAISCMDEALSTLMDGGLYPAFKTSRNLPSEESAVDMGSVSRGICLPAG